jgi:predicted nucleic acid-binding protein
MNVISVVADASVALKWFHGDGESEAQAAHTLVELYGRRSVSLAVLDLTPYEIGNALLRGRPKLPAKQVATVLDAMVTICPQLKPSIGELTDAAGLAERHDLTLYDATYASVARSRSAVLATMDMAILKADLGLRPQDVVAMVGGELE